MIRELLTHSFSISLGTIRHHPKSWASVAVQHLHPFIKIANVLACGVCVVLVLMLISHTITMRELDALRRELDVSDPEWRIQPIVDAHNATIASSSENPSTISLQNLGPKVDRLSRLFWDECSGVQHPNWSDARTARRVPPREQFDDVRHGCANHHAAFELARSARLGRVRGAPIVLAQNPLMTRIPSCEYVRMLVGLLSHDGIIAAVDGDLVRLVDNLEAMRHVVDGLTSEPFIMRHEQFTLLGILAQSVLDAIEYAAPNEAQLRQLQSTLNEVDVHAILRCGLRADRALFDTTLEHFRGTPADLHESGFRPHLGRPLAGFWIPHEQITYLHVMTELLTLVDRPTHEWLAAWKHSGIRTPAPHAGDGLNLHGPTPTGRLRWRPYANLLAPDERVLVVVLRTLVQLRATRIAVACERYRLLHGCWPTSLDALTPALLDSIPLDPYTGELMRMACRPDGLVIYATGLDRQDHGGIIPKPWEPEIVVKDEGIRLLNPLARRVPFVPPSPADDPNEVK
jgi:hypothetical protein